MFTSQSGILMPTCEVLCFRQGAATEATASLHLGSMTVPVVPTTQSPGLGFPGTLLVDHFTEQDAESSPRKCPPDWLHTKAFVTSTWRDTACLPQKLAISEAQIRNACQLAGYSESLL